MKGLGVKGLGVKGLGVKGLGPEGLGLDPQACVPKNQDRVRNKPLPEIFCRVLRAPLIGRSNLTEPPGK